MNVFADRIIRAAKLDARLYEEVEADTGAMKQAMGVVVLSSLAAGLGVVLRGNIGIILQIAISALVGWCIWAGLTYLIGAKLMPEPDTKANFGEMLRTIGFASAPGLIRVLYVVPELSRPVYLVSSLWMLAAMVVAVRQALDYKSTWRAFWVCFISWMIVAIAGGLIYLALSPGTVSPV